MACVYDEAIFQKFRALAVTDPYKIEVGKTYFSNSWPEKFIVKRVATELEFVKERSYYDPTHTYENTVPRWFFYDGEYGESSGSLQDLNCDDSYNPWLIFEDEETMVRCREEFKVEIVGDGIWDYDWDEPEYDYDPNYADDYS